MDERNTRIIFGHTTNGESPGVFVIVGDPYFILHGDDVIMNGQNCIRIRFDPGDLSIHEAH